MKNNQLSRYKIKKMRKKTPEIRFELCGEQLSEQLNCVVHKISRFAALLYDEVWPDWRKNKLILISLRMTSPEEISQLNGQYRDINEPTDVLTFPFFENEGAFVPAYSPLPQLLGEIVLCPQVINANADVHGASEISEFVLVIFHALLHLLAWDHDTPEKERKMWGVQEKYRDLFMLELNGCLSKERA